VCRGSHKLREAGNRNRVNWRRDRAFQPCKTPAWSTGREGRRTVAGQTRDTSLWEGFNPRW